MKMKLALKAASFEAGQAAYLFSAASPLPLRPCTIEMATENGVMVRIEGERVLLTPEMATHRLVSERLYESLLTRLTGNSSASAPVDDGSDLPEPPKSYKPGTFVAIYAPRRSKLRSNYMTAEYRGHTYVVGVVVGERGKRTEVALPLWKGSSYGRLLVSDTLMQFVARDNVPQHIQSAIDGFFNFNQLCLK